MKKLLTLAAVVCMATFAQAIAMTWTTSPDATWRTDCDTFTLVYTSNTGTVKTVADVAKILANETIDGYATVADAEGYFQSYSEGTLSVTTKADTGTYYMFFSGSDVAYGTSFDAATAPWSVVDGQNPTLDKLAVTFTNVSSAVPEPTVLALLALGVAGVALRRRRMA